MCINQVLQGQEEFPVTRACFKAYIKIPFLLKYRAYVITAAFADVSCELVVLAES